MTSGHAIGTSADAGHQPGGIKGVPGMRAMFVIGGGSRHICTWCPWLGPSAQPDTRSDLVCVPEVAGGSDHLQDSLLGATALTKASRMCNTHGNQQHREDTEPQPGYVALLERFELQPPFAAPLPYEDRVPPKHVHRRRAVLGPAALGPLQRHIRSIPIRERAGLDG